MKSKAIEHLLKEASVEYAEDGHTYKQKQTGEYYTGCTTISEAWDKSFFLGPWYAKEAINEAIKRIPDLQLALQENPKPDAAIEILMDCKGAAKRIGEIAKEEGKLAHDYMQRYIAVKMGLAKKVGAMPDKKEHPEAVNSIMAFGAWQKQHEVKWLASEEVVSSDEFRIGGTIDALAIVDGIPTLIDFKTSKQISGSYLLQCAGYDIMLREMGFQVRQYLILRLPKDGSDAETLTAHNLEEMQFMRDTFLKQREAHKFYVFVENKMKDLETRKIKVDIKVEDVIKKSPPKKLVKHGKNKNN